MSDVLTEEKIKAASDTVDTFLNSLSSADKRKQQKALSKYIEFLFDAQMQAMMGDEGDA